MTQLVFLLEEPSAKVMLEAIVPKIIDRDLDIRYVVFEGKQDLEKRLEMRLRAWQNPDTCFVILRDQDSGDCLEIKQRLSEKVARSGKSDTAVIRIACHELESFYLGDLKAVEQGLAISGIAQQQRKSKYRNPDALNNASEELSRLTRKKYHKLSGSRAIAPYMDISKNKSYSFHILVKGIRKILNDC